MGNRIANVWKKVVENTIPILFIAILIFYLIQCQIWQCDNSYYKVVGLAIIGVIICYYIGYKLCSKIESKSAKKYKLFLFIVSFVIYVLWGIFAKTPPISDYEVLINGAKSMARGEFPTLAFDKTNYFYFYNFQAGFVTYLAGIIKLFGERLIFIKLVEMLVMSLTNVFIYDIATKIYSRRCGVMSSMIYAILLFNIAGSSIINNQHISVLFMVIALWLFLKDRKLLHVLAGIFTGIAIIVRPSIAIFAIALICFKIWKVLDNNFKNFLKELFTIVILVISIFITVKGYDAAMRYSNQVPNSAVSANAKYFKFILGLKGRGLYNIQTQTAEKTQVYYDLEKLNFDYEKYDEECLKELKTSINYNTRILLRFINEKLVYFCGGADNQLGYAWEYVSTSRICDFMNYYGYIQYILLLLLALISSVIIFYKNKDMEYEGKNRKYSELLKILFIGFFLAHIFIEVQTRYRYEQYLILAILSSPVLVILFDKITKILDKYKKDTTEIKI